LGILDQNEVARRKIDMSEKIVNVTISRYDPTVDKEPYDQTFQVPVVEGMGVLHTLDYIYENLDGTISYFDHGVCAQGICKKCMIQINGKPALMCQTRVEDDVVLGPLPKFRVVKDLVYGRGGGPNED
jgi:succinate dehydrogenase/fumarate reductase-like Fe-S protein